MFGRDKWPPVAYKTFDDYVQLGHVVQGMVMVFGPQALGWGHFWTYAMAGCAVIAIKEAFIDSKYETPEIAGSGFEDWLFSTLGQAIAVLMCKLL